MNSIFTRISVRRYQDRPVEQEKVEQLLRAAMAAPSARNEQPWEFYVVTNREVLERLSWCSPYTHCAARAPLAIVPCWRKARRLAQAYNDIDLSAATENLLLEAVELGLGAVWMGVSPIRERMDAVAEVLSLPDTLEPFAIVPVGYPGEERPQEDRFDPDRIHYIP